DPASALVPYDAGKIALVLLRREDGIRCRSLSFRPFAARWELRGSIRDLRLLGLRLECQILLTGSSRVWKWLLAACPSHRVRFFPLVSLPEHGLHLSNACVGPSALSLSTLARGASSVR